MAAFPWQKTLDEFEFDQLNLTISPVFLKELASCQFISDRQNVIFIGNPERGNTHLSVALGMKACAVGFRVLFKNAAALSDELCEARDDYSLGRLQKLLRSVDFLILDELSYISFNRSSPNATNAAVRFFLRIFRFPDGRSSSSIRLWWRLLWTA